MKVRRTARRKNLRRGRTRKQRGGEHVDESRLTPGARNRVRAFRKGHDDYIKLAESAPNRSEVDLCTDKNVDCGPYPRYIMPQIEDIDAFIAGAAIVGITLSYMATEKTIGQMAPSQSEVSRNRVTRTANWIRSNPGALNEKPIVLSNDGYVIDGHHRYFALQSLEMNDKPISVYIINKPRDYVLEAAAAVGLKMARRHGWSGL